MADPFIPGALSMSTIGNKPKRPAPLPVSYVPPRCPACESLDILKTKRVKESRDVLMHYATCRECGAHLVLLAE